LLDELNKEKRYPITFTVYDDPQLKTMEAEEGNTILMRWFEIHAVAGSPYKELKKSQFLSWFACSWKERRFSVQNVIEYYAYARGGIHMQNRTDQKFQDLEEAFNIIKINGLSQLDHSMRGLVQVVFETLKQYKEQLLS
jgi:hypothetical protein